MAAYHTYDTFREEIEQLRALDRAGVIDRTVTSLGVSPDGRWRIPLLKIGRNPEERVLIVGNEHAREWIAGEVPFLIADALVKAANGAPLSPEAEPLRNQMRTLVDEREIWIAPVLNPEGRAYSQRGRNWWRKNRRLVTPRRFRTASGDTWGLLFRIFGPESLPQPPRTLGATHTGLESVEEIIEANRAIGVTSPDATLPVGVDVQIPVYGVDLNRNYPTHFGTRADREIPTPNSDDEAYPGTEGGSEWETRAVMDTMRRARQEGFPFRAALSYHSRIGVVMYPWAYTNRSNEEPAVAELAEQIAHTINQARNPSYDAGAFAARVRAAQDINAIVQQGVSRNEYAWALGGALSFAREGGSFMDWVWEQFHIPVFTIEIDPALDPSSPDFQEPETQIAPLFHENLAGALTLIERGGATLPGDALSNTVYACYLFPWCSRSDLALAWMKNGRFLRRVHWGQDVECTLLVRQPARVTSDLEAKFTVVESDVFRFSDDTLQTATLAIPHQQIQAGTRRFSIPWRVGDNQRRDSDDAYADASPTVEYQFRVDVAGDVLRSAEIDLVQGAGVSWEVPDPFVGTFFLIGRFRGMPVQLDFTGTFTILVTYEADSSGYETVKTFSFHSNVDTQRITRQNETIEVRQTVTVEDLRAPAREQDVRDYPFKVADRIERVNVNLTREPRYAFEFKIVVGGQDFKRRVEDIRVRMFEGTIVSEQKRPRLQHVPGEDDPRERAYRQRMVTVPPEVVEAIRREAARLNPASDLNWWSNDPLQASTDRGVLSPQRVADQLRVFAGLAATDAEAHAFMETFDVGAVERRFGGMPRQFWSMSDADRDVRIEISGEGGRPASRETIVLAGTQPVRLVNDYSRITGIRVESGQLKGVLFVGTTMPDALSPIAVNVSERAVRYQRLNELNEFLREGGSVLDVSSTDSLDRLQRVIVVGRVDSRLREQSFEAIHIGSTGRKRFFKVTDIFLGSMCNGVLSLRASRDGATRTLWRNIYDEDIPEKFASTLRQINQPSYVVTGQRAAYLQMLANAIRDHLGIEKNVRVFINATSGLRSGNLVADTSFEDAADSHLVAVQGTHGDFLDKSMVRVLAHEVKHAFQRDRSMKLANPAGLSVSDLGRSTDTFDLRAVKAWMLNSNQGYIGGGENMTEYRRQIREVDSEQFGHAVFASVV